MTPGPMDFRGPIMGLLASGGPAEGPWASEGAHRNETEKSACKDRRPFFYGDHLISIGKTVRISVKTFFLEITSYLTKLRHFLRLFWSSQNWKYVMFELAPGPGSALGAPGLNRLKKGFGGNPFGKGFSEGRYPKIRSKYLSLEC